MREYQELARIEQDGVKREGACACCQNILTKH